MAIGKIDCTVEKKLCDQHGVRGYPTLKFSLDGEVHEYPGGRKESEFVAFAEKMNRPTVQMISSVPAAMEFASQETDEGVVFLAYHPDVKGSTIDEQTQSSLLTQVFAQVARKQRAYGHFLLLDPSASAKEILNKEPSEPFVCRLEANVDPRCFDKVDSINTVDLLDFVKVNNVPTVSHLGPGNFHKIGRSGRPLAIGVVDTDNAEQVALAKKQLATFATGGPEKLRNKYYYGWFDGKQWQRFLAQFDVIPAELPQVFVLDVPKKTYWQNASYALNIDDFLAAIEDGTVTSKSAGKQGWEGTLDRLYYAIIEYRPWSVVLLVIILLSLGAGIAACVSPGEDLRPPYKKPVEEKKIPENKEQSEDTKEAEGESTESKKDK